jgi:hypothetical protein
LICAAAIAVVALAGCSDPSPGSPASEQTSSSSAEPADPTTEAATGSTTSDTTDAAPEPPVFGVGTSGGGTISACVDIDAGSAVSMITVLTAVDTITIDDLTVEADGAPYDGDILDAFVLPFGGGPGGLTIDDYPPDDPTGERQDATGHELEAGTTVMIGVGLATDEPTEAPVSLVVDYTDAVGNAGTATAPHTLTLQSRCAS